MNYLKIRNWNTWQSYRKDRGQPPWIKLHRCVMRDPEWVLLSDAQRGQLVAMWLLAADRDGVIPASPLVLQKICFMSSEPELKLFIELGFIDDDANVTPSGSQSDANMTHQRREEESREEESREVNRRFAPPSIQEVTDYCVKRNNKIDPELFIDHYEANGWMRGKNKIKCWKSCIRTWEKQRPQHETNTSKPKSAAGRFMENLKNA